MGYHQASREDGHTLLLMEAREGERTFSDYPDERTCLDTVVEMYEQYRASLAVHGDSDLREFHVWIDGFHRIDMLVYDKSIARYKQTSKEALKDTFEQKSPTVSTLGLNELVIQNGKPHQNRRLRGDDDDDENIEESWDN